MLPQSKVVIVDEPPAARKLDIGAGQQLNSVTVHCKPGHPLRDLFEHVKIAKMFYAPRVTARMDDRRVFLELSVIVPDRETGNEITLHMSQSYDCAYFYLGHEERNRLALRLVRKLFSSFFEHEVDESLRDPDGQPWIDLHKDDRR